MTDERHHPGSRRSRLDRHLQLTRRQLDSLVASTDKLGAGTTVEEALAALSLTLEELEVATEELRAQNDALLATRHQLERERQRFQQLFDLAPEAYVVTDTDGVVRDANRQAERLLGRRSSELRDKPLAVFVRQDERTSLRALIRGADDGRVQSLDVVLAPRDGDERRANLTVRRGLHPDGTPELRWMATDATGRDLARAALSRRLDTARRSADGDEPGAGSSWHATLLGAAAHDLSTPLGVVSGAVETLLEHWDRVEPDRARRILEGAQAQSAKLRRVLQGFMDISRMQLQAVPTRREVVGLHDLVTRVTRELEVGDRTVRVDVPENLTVHVDPGQVERVVENLVSNAASHTPEGSTVWIATKLVTDDPDALLLVVEDDGPGVDDDVKELVFEPFVRTDDTDDGTGLGLAIVAMFASFHGGAAWVEDRPGGGASFHVLLPSALADG